MSAVPVVQKGSIGTLFGPTLRDRDRRIIDLSTATAIECRFEKPDGTVFSRAGSLDTDGTDGVPRYATVAGDIDTTGRWKYQFWVALAAGDEFGTHPDDGLFLVVGNLEVTA